MRHISGTLYLIVLCFFIGCKDNEPEIQKELLTVVVDSGYKSTSWWIMLHDDSGQLLEYQKLIPGEQSIISTNKKTEGNIFSATVLKYEINAAGSKFFTLTSYTDLSPGHTIFLKLAPSNPLRFVDNAKVNVVVNKVPSPLLYFSPVLSSPLGGLTSSSNNDDANKQLYIESKAINASADFLFMTPDPVNLAGNSKYKIINNVTSAGGSYTFDYNELSDFDRYVNFTFPASSSFVLDVTGRKIGAPDNWSFFFMHREIAFNRYTRTFWKPGYLNGFTDYITRLQIDYSGYSFLYTQRGSIPDGNVAWPKVADFGVGNKTLATFSSLAHPSLKYRLSRWSYDWVEEKTSTFWTVFSPSTNHQFNDFPTELLDLFPSLKLNKLEYSHTSFYLGPKTYDNFLDAAFGVKEESIFSEVGISLKK